MTESTQPAAPPLTVLTQQGSSVRGHDPAQQKKITQYYQELLRYRPFVEMVVNSGMDVSKGVSGIRVQLTGKGELFLHVKNGNGISTPFVIGQDTSQGFVAISGVDEKIVEATKFFLNPSAPNATPPDFAPPAATTPPANEQQPAQPSGPPQPQASGAPQPTSAPQTQPPGAPQQPQPPQPAIPQQPPLPIPDPVADPQVERFETLQISHKEALQPIFTLFQTKRSALFVRHDAEQASLPAASRAITREHKSLLHTLRQELIELQGRQEQQIRDLLEDRQVLQKKLYTLHLEERRNIANQAGADILALLARQFDELNQQKQDELDIYRGLHQQHQDELANHFAQQVPRRHPLSPPLRNLLATQQTETTTQINRNQTVIITRLNRQHNQIIQIHQQLQQVEALSVINDIITAVGPFAIPSANATLPESTMIAKAEVAVMAAEKAYREATASQESIPPANTAELAAARVKVQAVNAAYQRVMTARDSIRNQAKIAKKALIDARAPSQAVAQLAIANTARITAEEQLVIAKAQAEIAENAATEARNIAQKTLERRNRNLRWGTRATQALWLGAIAVKALSDYGVDINALLSNTLAAIPKPF